MRPALTSVTSEGAQGVFSKVTFLRSECSNKKDEIYHSFLVKITKPPLTEGVHYWASPTYLHRHNGPWHSYYLNRFLPNNSDLSLVLLVIQITMWSKQSWSFPINIAFFKTEPLNFQKLVWPCSRVRRKLTFVSIVIF